MFIILNTSIKNCGKTSEILLKYGLPPLGGKSIHEAMLFFIVLWAYFTDEQVLKILSDQILLEVLPQGFMSI